MKSTKFMLALFFCITVTGVFAQQSLFFNDAYAKFRKAEELFNLQQYAAAADLFEQVQAELPPPAQDEISSYYVNASYYRAVCAVELYNPDAEQQMLAFHDSYEGHPRSEMASYYLGKYYFRNKKYRDASGWLVKVNSSNLGPQDRDDYAFQLGYCWFNRKQFADAKPLFGRVRNPASRYYYPANYYYAYISLEDGNYDDALKSFEIAGESKSYKKVVPYYIAQVYFAKGEYEKVLEYATELMDDSRIKYYAELQQLVGQTYYAMGQHDKALPYLQYYVDHAKRVHKEDYFQLGVAQYSAGRYEDAIVNFERLNISEDSLGQQALFLSADSHLKLGDKESARSSFLSASKKDFNPDKTRDAKFNYAKLSYELGYFEVAIDELTKFMNEYPDYESKLEGQEILADALLRTRNFQKAIEIIDAVADKSPAMQGAFQKVSFYRGVEHYEDRNYEEAEKFFNESRKYTIDKGLDASALFWLGELNYRKKSYSNAVRLHQEFQDRASGLSSIPGNANLASSNYTIAYSYFEQEKYSSAKKYFELVGKHYSIASKDRTEKQIATDATLRLGDSHFMLKNYSKAEPQYREISAEKLAGADYALFQLGMIEGLQGKLDEKTRTLQGIYRDYPNSIYLDDALYEIGNTHFVLGNNQSAIATLEKLLVEKEKSSYTSKVLLKLGLIYYNQGQNNKALEYYTKVANDYKGSDEGREALGGIRDISVEESNPEIYTSLAGVTLSERDSVTWISAYNKYLAEDCEAAIKGFDKYLIDFPNGYFASSAHFDRSECFYQAEQYTEALPGYEYILKRQRSKHTETALLKAARIAYFELKDLNKAVQWYGELYEAAEYQNNTYEALKGLVRANFDLGNHDKVIRYAAALTASTEATQDEITEAEYYLAKSYHQDNKINEAYTAYGKVADRTTNEWGVEARFQRALIEFRRGDFDQSKETCLDLINNTPKYEMWVIRSYILVADVLREQGELVQAKGALVSIVDNYKGDQALLELATQKLKEIENIEASRSRLDEQGDEFDYLEEIPLDNQLDNP